jgi:hypothetical protein
MDEEVVMSKEEMNDEQLAQLLRARLGQLKRPSIETLAEYELNLLPADEAAAIRRYLAQHPHAAAQLDELRALWQDYQPTANRTPSAAGSSLQSFKLWLAEKVGGSTLPARPALAGIRGDAELVYRAGPVQLVLDVDDDPQQPGRRSLTGLLLNLPDGDWLARLWPTDNGSQEQEWETAVAPDATFMLDGLPSATYSLLIRSRAETAVIEIYVESVVI